MITLREHPDAVITVTIRVDGHEASAGYPLFWGKMSEEERFDLLKHLVNESMNFYKDIHVRKSDTKD